MKARVLIAIRQAPNRAALRLLLQERHASEVVGEAADSAELLAQLAAREPNVVLLQWDLPGQPTEDLLRAVRGLDHRPEVIVLSGRPELEPRARAAGADAFVSLCEPPQRLLAALQAIEGGREAQDRSPRLPVEIPQPGLAGSKPLLGTATDVAVENTC